MPQSTLGAIAYIVFDNPEKASLYEEVLLNFQEHYMQTEKKLLFIIYENQDTLDKLAETALANNMSIVYVVESPMTNSEYPFNIYNQKRLGHLLSLLSEKNFPFQKKFKTFHLFQSDLADPKEFDVSAIFFHVQVASYSAIRSESKDTNIFYGEKYMHKALLQYSLGSLCFYVDKNLSDKRKILLENQKLPFLKKFIERLINS